MKKTLFFGFCQVSLLAASENNTSVILDPIQIEGRIRYVDIDDRNGFVGETVGRDALETLVGPAQTGSYKSLDLSPSVNQQSADAFGLALGKTLRMRGSYSGDDFLRNVEGLPVSSHGGGGDFIDFENIAFVETYRGAVTPEDNLGLRNLTGGMNLHLLWPQLHPAAHFRQVLGSNNMHRTFLRLDSGETSTDTRFFLSFSDTGADKWRGAGEAPGKRRNIEFGLSHDMTDSLNVKLLAIRHELEQNDYRALSYAQTQDLSDNYTYDYNTHLLGDPTQDGFYFDYTRQSYKDNMLLSEITYALTDSASIRVKPYYWKDTGYRYIGRGSSVTYLTISPVQYGLTASYDMTFDGGSAFSLGYWYQNLDDSLPPPLAMRSYSLNADGSLAFSKWTLLGKIGTRNYQAPYLDYTLAGENWNIKAGVRYLIQKDPSASFYDTDGVPDVSYDEAFAYSSGINHAMDMPSRTWGHFLPTLGGAYDLQNGLTFFAGYARGYGYTAWPAQIMSYSFKKANLDAAGISFADLWRGLKPEEIDNFDLGLTHTAGVFKSRINGYYSLHKNKTVTVYDAAADVSYLKSDADATSYGAEATLSAALPKQNLHLYATLSYNIYRFDNDVTTALNNTVSSKGKQVPDTPEEMLKVGADYRIGRFAFHPVLKYIGKRYGDIENTESADAYTLIDLQAVYAVPKFAIFQDARFSLSCYNLTDQKYIGKIDTSDFQLDGASGYYPGAPFSIAAALDMRF